VFYLYLHLAVLSLLLRGEQAWSDFLRIATSWAFLSLDVLLLFGLLYHGLNGIRVALVGTGVVPNRQKALWWSLGVIGTIALIGGALHIAGSA
jgi:succinate dehydrogenase cytochrome b subunit